MDEPHDEERTMMRSQIKTLRVQIHAVECRLFDMEMAQIHGATRADVHADEIKDIKNKLSEVIASLDGIATA